MKKIFYILFFAFLLSLPSASVKALLTDSEKTNLMVRKGVPFPGVINAKKNPSEENIIKLILAAAPVYPLEEILDLYPASKGKKGGEEGFFEKCKNDLNLFCEFFAALGGNSFLHEGKIINPLEYNPDPYSFIVSDTSRGFNQLQSLGSFVSQRKCVRYTDYFTHFKPSTKVHINFAFILKLLETNLAAPSPSLKKNNESQFNQRKWVRVMAPLIRGQLALIEECDVSKAHKWFTLALERAPREDLKAFLDLHMAEIYLGAVQPPTSRKAHELLDEVKGVRLLEQSKLPYAQLRLGQYYLGFFGHKIDESKGLTHIQEAMRKELVSHLALRTFAEYRLGVTNPDALDLVEANQFLDKTFEACEGIISLEACVHVRRAEIAMGLFTEDSDGLESPIDILKATQLLEKIKPTGLMHLYQIYAGHYGSDFKNAQSMNCILDGFENQDEEYSSFFTLQQAIRELAAGHIDEAILLFKRYSSVLLSSYYLGCIYSNASYYQHYNPLEALIYLTRAARHNFRDSCLRVAKVFLENSGFSITDSADTFWLVNQLLRGESNIQKSELVEKGFTLDGIQIKENLENESAPQQTTKIEITEETKAPIIENIGKQEMDPPEELSFATQQLEEDTYFTDPLDIQEVESPEHSSFVRQQIKALNTATPVRTLADTKLQEMYDQMGTTIKWKKLLKIVQAFEGKIDMGKKQIRFPNSEEVFNFHLLHSGNPSLSLSGYWRVLKSMIDHEYNVRCDQEANQIEE